MTGPPQPWSKSLIIGFDLHRPAPGRQTGPLARDHVANASATMGLRTGAGIDAVARDNAEEWPDQLPACEGPNSAAIHHDAAARSGWGWLGERVGRDTQAKDRCSTG